jgi:hypothetical protein
MCFPFAEIHTYDIIDNNYHYQLCLTLKMQWMQFDLLAIV